MELIRPHWPLDLTEDKPLFPRVEPGVFEVALGNGTQWEFHVFLWDDDVTDPPWLVVGIEGHGSARFSQWAHIAYVLEKLGGVKQTILPGDAGNIADFINSQLLHYQLTEHYKGMPLRQGQYKQDLCTGSKMPGGEPCPKCDANHPPGADCRKDVGESAEPSGDKG
jgi:hypothetical protein